MVHTPKSIELLAPAKDHESGCAVINCGADAVYIGANRFGAREAAGNNLSDIKKVVTHAHRYYAKVYATLNTLLRDEEIEPAVQLCHALADVGVDGLILQDLGLLECDLPPLPIIASTQMHNHTTERVAFWEKVGFSRVILARELSLEQIRSIRSATQVELEVFVHGALCVCMSGQCYLSQAIGGRSGNRGQCAQPCRRMYVLNDGQGRALAPPQHWLSLQDLNLSSYLGDLLDAGVTSFKIEGRLKNKAYAMNIVGYYRRRLDEAMASRGLRKSSSGISHLGFVPNPHKTFNRGYTTYFFLGRGAEVASSSTPKHVGEPVGHITSADPQSITLESTQPLHPGDGITYFGEGNHLDGSVINQVRGKRLYLQRPAKLAPGTRVFRNHDQAFVAQLNKALPKRTIAVRLRLREDPQGLLLEALDEDGVGATARLGEPTEPAHDAHMATVQTKHHLAKLGDTIFHQNEILVEWNVPQFLPAATINGLRRRVVESLLIAREDNRSLKRCSRIQTNHPFPSTHLSFTGNVLNTKAAQFFRRHGIQDIEPACERGYSLEGRVVMTSTYCLKYELGYCPKVTKTTCPPEPWTLVDDEGRRLPVRFRCELKECVMEIIYGASPKFDTG